MEKEFELPDIGIEADVEITVSFWYIEEDEEFEEGDDILEVSTNKANLNVTAPYTGKLIEILAQEGDVVTIGDVIAMLEKINT
ncbi:pyruvate/2-oxoglutarate dehydrogenase complex, dihydrolipoamide acyltransferase (E2) component [Candidatus Scalindua japonica]|uniref:Pyruvate/2-oxoglutarate dehydrogenase complex, dihydrolipoamide acyltransferase (E2) component n=1 Tax=Candidatus Scalindua japonica TaxID=1284222 RepID=A0A286TU82_9BACT|nr:biotin/lipoyl-containing protein [Candidatus Scalindua japonica]GAX59452.1 pyruvate/2-oxoglutarate dehydrogenase complex, dihydrolipoamide acyltransferase (E2) component [Candidatus Scalindua japonica]